MVALVTLLRAVLTPAYHYDSPGKPHSWDEQERDLK